MIVGHKNPDTDSICSAIAYAHFKQEILKEPARPYRAGSLNPQTAFVLERFGVTEPDLLHDLHPKLRDIMIPESELLVLDSKAPLLKAQSAMCEYGFTFLPVADDEGKLAGKITALKLAEMPNEVASMGRRERVEIDLSAFREAVNGTSVTQKELPPQFSGRLAIHGIEGQDRDYKNGGDVMLITPKSDAQRIDEAIATGTGIIIVTACEEIDSAVVEKAGGAGICVMTSPENLLEVVVRATLCMPVESYLQTEFPTFQCDDRVRQVQKDIGQYHEGGFIVVDDDKRIRGIVTRSSFINEHRFKVALVDHNEFGQAVDGIHDAEVTEIIDHHRLGNANTDTPITFINKTVGCTATIIAEMYRVKGIDPEASIAGLMLSAILSDTVVLRSPTTTAVDIEVAQWLAGLAGVDCEKYGSEMFAAGSSLSDVSAEEIVGRDMKGYEELGWKFSVSQIETVGLSFFEERKESLEAALQASVQANGRDFAGLMVTDITRETSLLLFFGAKQVHDAIPFPEIAENVFEMKSVLSRKKQALPSILDCLRSLE